MQIFGDLLHVVTGDAEAAEAQITRALKEESIELKSIAVRAVSLEDVFVSTIENERALENGDIYA